MLNMRFDHKICRRSSYSLIAALTMIGAGLCFSTGLSAEHHRTKSKAWFNPLSKKTPGNRDKSVKYDVNRGVLASQANRRYLAAGEQLARQLAQANSGKAANKVIRIVKEGVVKEINKNAQNGPDWLSRIEVGFEYETGSDPIYSISSVQPVYQSKDKINTIFTQLRYARHKQFDESRDTTNIGLGYRELVSNKTVLVGANVHYDREWERRHDRLGIGLETRWNGADLFINRYKGLSNKKTISSTKTEEILDGWDAQALVQMPYIPSARILLVGSHWRKSSSEHISGFRAGVEADLSSSLRLEFGTANDNDANDMEMFVGLRFSIGGFRTSENLFLQKNFVSDSPWQMRDMSEHTLDRVRREDTIRLKRTTTSSGGSITVAVSRG